MSSGMKLCLFSCFAACHLKKKFSWDFVIKVTYNLNMRLFNFPIQPHRWYHISKKYVETNVCMQYSNKIKTK